MLIYTYIAHCVSRIVANTTSRESASVHSDNWYFNVWKWRWRETAK